VGISVPTNSKKTSERRFLFPCDHILGMLKSDYRKLLEEKRAWYKNIGRVHCPCLGTDVIFNSKGFYHLRYGSDGKERSIEEQVKRLQFLSHVPNIIKSTNYVYEHRSDSESSKEYWAFQKNFSGNRVRIVLTRTGNGNIIFLSVMEKTNKKTVTD